MEAWIVLERAMSSIAAENTELGIRPRSILDTARFLQGKGLLTSAQLRDIDYLRQIRNEVTHGVTDHREAITPDVVSRVRKIAESFKNPES